MEYENAKEFWKAIDRGEKGATLKPGVIKKCPPLFEKIQTKSEEEKSKC